MSMGTYIGERKSLRGKVAIIRRTENENEVLAQFNDKNLGRKKTDILVGDDPPPNYLGYGWHRFRTTDFHFEVTGTK